MFTNEQVEAFLKSKAFAVAGASSNRDKYGNKVLRCYMQHQLIVYPLNPKEKSIEGINVVKSISELPADVESLSIITPPAITEQVVSEAIKKGIKHIWMQPGAESEKAIRECITNKLNVIAKGPCILVALGYRETP